MNILVDNREKSSRIKSCVGYFTDEHYDKNQLEYSGKGNHLTVKKLPVGDYIFDDRLCIEYKTAIDMIGSIMDGRVFNQAHRMKEYPYSYVLIVGNVSEEINTYNQNQYYRWNKKPKRSFTIKHYLGAIASLSTYSNVLHVSNMTQGWILMESLSGKVDNTKEHVVKGLRLDNPIASFLTCVPVSNSSRLSSKKALKITEDLGLETLDDLLKLSFDDLKRVNGVGVKTAVNIMNTIKDEDIGL